jgi:hypothetical protein
VDSVGRAIEKNGKSPERVANLTLRYRLIRKAGLNNAEQQAAYRKLLLKAERNFDGDGSGILAGDNSSGDNNDSNVLTANPTFNPGPRFPPMGPHIECAEELTSKSIDDDNC